MIQLAVRNVMPRHHVRFATASCSKYVAFVTKLL